MSVHDSDINKVLTCIARGDDLWELQRAVDGLLVSQDVSPEEPADDFLKWLYLAIEGSTSGEYYLSTSEPWLEQPDVWPTCLRGSELWHELFRAVGRLPPKEIERCMVVVTAAMVSKWPNYQWLLDHRAAKSALTSIGTARNAGIPSDNAETPDYGTLNQTVAAPLSDDALANSFKDATERFSDAQWSEKFERQYRARAQRGQGRNCRSFYIENVGGIYYGDARTFVFKSMGRRGYYSLCTSHSERIGKIIAGEFSLYRHKGRP